MGLVVVAVGEIRMLAGGEAHEELRGFFLAEGQIEGAAGGLQIHEGNMILRGDLPDGPGILAVGIEQAAAADKEAAADGGDQDRGRAFGQGGAAIEAQILPIGCIRIRMALVILLIVMAELDQEQVAGGQAFLHGSKAVFREETAGAAAGFRMIENADLRAKKAGKGPAPAPEGRCVVGDGGVADDKYLIHTLTSPP